MFMRSPVRILGTLCLPARASISGFVGACWRGVRACVSCALSDKWKRKEN